MTTFTRKQILFAGVALLAAGLPVAFAAAKPSGTITGEALYRERMALPPGAVFEASLLDTSLADAAAQTISSVQIKSPGNPPIHFKLKYDRARIVASHSYSVRATIQLEDRLLFTTDASYPVLTQGHGKQVSLLLKRPAQPPPPAESAAAGAALEGTEWTLVKIGDEAVGAGSTPQVPSLLFTAEGHRVSGSTGCNRLTGGYEMDGGSLHFTPLATTRMMCMKGMATEQKVLQALGAVRSWAVGGAELELKDADGKSLLTYEKK